MPIRGYEIFDVRQRYIQDKYFHQIVKIKHFNLGQGQANSFYPPNKTKNEKWKWETTMGKPHRRMFSYAPCVRVPKGAKM